MRSTDWMELASCAGHPNPDIFFPNVTGLAARQQAEEAALICRECPVRVECGEHQQQTGASVGVWGGNYHHIKPRQRQRKPIQHGTNAGYNQHLDRSEKPCDRCRFAHAWKERERVGGA